MRNALIDLVSAGLGKGLLYCGNRSATWCATKTYCMRALAFTTARGVARVLTRRRGVVFHEEQRPGTPMVQMKAHMPVMESFGFNADVRAATGGKAFPQMVFSHWQVLAGDPTDPETKPGKVITDVRARKGLAPEIPPLDRFLDRL